MEVWYRHSGEPEVDRFPPPGCKFAIFQDVEELTSKIGDHQITHMWIRRGDMPSSFLTICGRLTHLKISAVEVSSQLQW